MKWAEDCADHSGEETKTPQQPSKKERLSNIERRLQTIERFYALAGSEYRAAVGQPHQTVFIRLANLEASLSQLEQLVTYLIPKPMPPDHDWRNDIASSTEGQE